MRRRSLGLRPPLIISQPRSAPFLCPLHLVQYPTLLIQQPGHGIAFSRLCVPLLPLRYVIRTTPHPVLVILINSLQAITIVSNAIICSAAAWNLPISQNIAAHSKPAHKNGKGAVLIHSSCSPSAHRRLYGFPRRF